MKKTTGIIAVVVIIVIVAIAYLVLSPGKAPGTSFTIPSYATFLGSASAQTNIIEFGDYQCPVCSVFFKQEESSIINDYVNTGKAKFYFLDFSFLGPDSFTLSQGAWCANEQGKYYDYYAYIYANQGLENSGWGTADKVKTLASNINGLNSTAFNACLDSGKYSARTNELVNLAEGAGLTSTPSLLIGNSTIGYTLVVGVVPYSSLKQTIDSQIG